MSDVDLKALRAQFPAEIVGKLPRVTCSQCSRGSCGDHKKISCPECKSWISERHIHIDYVGHADVTDRLLDVDPEWSWAPKTTDPDPELLKAAVASGDAEIVRMLIENAPPKFDLDKNGNPVSFWIKLTVGGITRLGVGSCPGNQADAEKVLIGDALRNAAMRFGVATYLWAKGERADPTAENPAESAGHAARRRQQPANSTSPRGQVSRPVQQAAPAADTDLLGDWSVTIDGITSEADADRADTKLRQMFNDKRIDATRANAIRLAIKAKATQIARAAA